MKEKPLHFRQIEWWLVTIVIFLIILTNILGGKISLESLPNSRNSDAVARYFGYIFMPLILYGTFYFMHIKILPSYLKDGRKAKLIIYTIMVFLISWILTGAFFVGGNFGKDFFIPFYFTAIALYLGYIFTVIILKKLLLSETKPNFLAYNIIRSIILYFFMMFFLLKFQRYFNEVILITYVIVIPSLIAIFTYNFLLIFRLKEANRQGEAKAFYWLLPFIIAAVFTIISIDQNAPEVLVVGAIAIMVLLIVINPLSNIIFMKYHSFLGQIDTLNVKLDQQSADLQLLRSQINPHFLFNALNTLYATSLQENAEKTAEGIQKLGDMMRFMLHENHQEKILVEREKEYLINYVDLQLLRIKEEGNIEIIFNRNEEECKGEIAPMLLIPFVENAFKHGISLQKKSWVKISLRCMEGSLHLDINNSIHRKTDIDPEKKASGIGLQNVQQRLKLLYPDQHELIIRENELEYFVHLSIQLTKRNAKSYSH